MVKTMKIKRFEIERVPVEFEYIRPIAGRLYMLLCFVKLIRHVKVQPTISGVAACKPIHILCIPKKIKSSGSE